MARAVRDWLGDIAVATKDIFAYVDGVERTGFLDFLNADRRNFRAIKQALAEIGEAIKNLPADITERWPSIEWRGLAGLRDIVSHAYFKLDPTRLFDTIVEDLPSLENAVEAEIRRLDAIPIVHYAVSKGIGLQRPFEDLLDDLASGATSDQIAAMVANLHAMADFDEFVRDHGVCLPTYD